MSEQDISSYPPSFEPADSIPRISSGEPDPLPWIDFEQLNQEEIGKACREWGMFRLVNHGIPMELTAQLQEQSKKVFSLAFEAKQARLQSPLSYFWDTPALSPKGVPLTQGVQNVDRVEGIFALLDQLPQITGDDPMLISFRSLLEEYGKHMSRLAQCLFKALTKNKGMDPALSTSYLSESTGIIRVYRYLQCSEPDKVEGMGVHTDSSVLSILNQDDVGGLQVWKDDKWIEARPVTNTLVINVGDMLQAMSDDEYRSLKHRVMKKREERMSICYFVFPEDDGVIQSTKYRPFTYKDFRAQVQEDIKTLGTKVAGLQAFRPTYIADHPSIYSRITICQSKK